MRYIKIRHSETNQEVIIDTYEARYRRMAMGFMNSLKLDKRFVKHITLTQKIENYKPNLLNYFFCKMRRWYGDLIYLWAVEVQEERFEKTGARVLHWHVMVGFPVGVFKGKRDVKRIQKFWGYGNVDIKPVRCPNTRYLMKYVTKALNIRSLEFYQVRKTGSSRIAGWLKQSWNRVLDVLAYFSPHGLCDDRLNLFAWVRGRAYGFDEWGRKILVYRPRPTPWYCFDKLDLLTDL